MTEAESPLFKGGWHGFLAATRKTSRSVAEGDASRRQTVVDLMAMKPLGTLKEVACGSGGLDGDG